MKITKSQVSEFALAFLMNSYIFLFGSFFLVTAEIYSAVSDASRSDLDFFYCSFAILFLLFVFITYKTKKHFYLKRFVVVILVSIVLIPFFQSEQCIHSCDSDSVGHVMGELRDAVMERLWCHDTKGKMITWNDCNAGTLDAGKSCTNYKDCEGYCYVANPDEISANLHKFQPFYYYHDGCNISPIKPQCLNNKKFINGGLDDSMVPFDTRFLVERSEFKLKTGVDIKGKCSQYIKGDSSITIPFINKGDKMNLTLRFEDKRFVIMYKTKATAN